MYSRVESSYIESKYYSDSDFNLLFDKAKNNCYSLDISDIYLLLNVSLYDKRKQKEIINYVSKRKYLNHKNNLHAIIPQYHTSRCIDDCMYCSFRKSNANIIRRELNDSDFENELKLILSWGYTSIEFVYSTDSNFPAQRIAQRIICAKNIGKSVGKQLEIGINTPTLSFDDYKILNNAGADFVLLWMETYSKDYVKWHPGNTPKSNFNFRVNTFDRSIQAGIKKYAFAVLFGLSNWIDDLVSLITHGLYLRKTYGVEPYIIGNPRLKHAMGLSVENSKYIIDDDNYIFINYFLKLVFPQTRLFINTREQIDINLQLINGGGDFFTIDCGTFPGAYLNYELIKDGQEQFHTFNYNRKNTINLLQRAGYKIIF